MGLEKIKEFVQISYFLPMFYLSSCGREIAEPPHGAQGQPQAAQLAREQPYTSSWRPVLVNVWPTRAQRITLPRLTAKPRLGPIRPATRTAPRSRDAAAQHH